jgi:hypothetical protein
MLCGLASSVTGKKNMGKLSLLEKFPISNTMVTGNGKNEGNTDRNEKLLLVESCGGSRKAFGGKETFAAGLRHYRKAEEVEEDRRQDRARCSKASGKFRFILPILQSYRIVDLLPMRKSIVRQAC